MVVVNRVVCAGWLVVCSTVDKDNSDVDEINFDVLCSSVVIDGEVGEVLIEEDVVSSVELLSLVDDSNLVVIADISVVNVD